MEQFQGDHDRIVGCCTYKHLDGDRDSAVEWRGASILGHHRQVNNPVGHLLVVKGVVYTDH